MGGADLILQFRGGKVVLTSYTISEWEGLTSYSVPASIDGSSAGQNAVVTLAGSGSHRVPFPDEFVPGRQMVQGCTPLYPEVPLVQCWMQSPMLVDALPVVLWWSGQASHVPLP